MTRVVLVVGCMNEQLKCREMLLQNSLYFLEYCIAPRDQYILGVIVNNICNQLTVASLYPTLKQHTFVHNNISVFAV